MSDEMIQLPRYQSHKKVWALEIECVIQHGDKKSLLFKDQRYSPREVKDELFSRYFPKSGDFWVQYEGGYESFSPHDEFVNGYTKI